jgi:hypothetical protein
LIVLRHSLGHRDQILTALDQQQGTTGKERLQFLPVNRCGFSKQLGIEGGRLSHG